MQHNGNGSNNGTGSNRFKRWSDDERGQIFEAVRKGDNFDAIGKRIGRSAKAVELELMKHVRAKSHQGFSEEEIIQFFGIKKEFFNKCLEYKTEKEKQVETQTSNTKLMEDLNRKNDELIKKNDKIIQLM